MPWTGVTTEHRATAETSSKFSVVVELIASLPHRLNSAKLHEHRASTSLINSTDSASNFSLPLTASTEKKSKKMLLYLTGLVFAMVGCSYAAVPLYRRFCQATGYGGTVQRKESVEEKIARHSKDGTVSTREIVVQFNADVADGMPWKFIPTQREVRVKPGESALAFYTAENRSSTPITGVSTYNVTPMKAAVYFNKIQCFCFEEQRLLPGEQIDMPVFFYIDPEFETDPKMDGINNIILSYTFFKVSDEYFLALNFIIPMQFRFNRGTNLQRKCRLLNYHGYAVLSPLSSPATHPLFVS
nr:cytochrome C oxidase assembly protein COX11, mitochondrial [Ipomoea batatas]